MSDDAKTNAANPDPSSELPKKHERYVNPLEKLTEEDWKQAMIKGQQDAESQSATIRAMIDLHDKRAGAPPRVKAVLDQVDSHTLSVTKLWELARDPEIRGRLQLIEHWLKDVESAFLEQLWLQPREPGSPGEVWALDQAEMYLQFAIAPQIEAVREIITGHASKTSS